MTTSSPSRIAIACGGTGGHLFPGLAVGEQLVQRGCAVTLFVSPKDIDQAVAKLIRGMDVKTLPGVGLSRGRGFAFARGFVRSYRAASACFKATPPHAALAMGGFTSAPPILAARKSGAQTFLHESNTIPGRANRWLARIVDGAFVGFPQAAQRLPNRNVTCIGTPVRPSFQPLDPVSCRTAIGLDPNRPVLLVMGGSQGASGINDLIIRTLPALAKSAPQLQLFHLAGASDADRVLRTCADLKIKAVVHGFFREMELALGAATIAVSRAGASSLAELAAMRVPAILIPFPAATGNHQFFNAEAYRETGAARVLEQKWATPDGLNRLILDLIRSGAEGGKMQAALAKWHQPDAAERIADSILRSIETTQLKLNPQASAARHSPHSKRHSALQTGILGLGMTALLWSLQTGERFL